MWAAISDEGGNNTYPHSFSHSHVHRPIKQWRETVDRLWRLRQQHWQETSKLRPHHQHHPHSQQNHLPPQYLHPSPHSHHYSDPHQISQPHPHPHLCSHAHPHPRPRPRPQSYAELPHRAQHQHHPHQHQHPHQDAHQSQCRGRHQHQYIQPSPYITNSRLSYQSKPSPCSTILKLPLHSSSRLSNIHDKVDHGFPTLHAHAADKPLGKQTPMVVCAKATQVAATSTQQNHATIGIVQGQKRTMRSSAGWKEEVLPVPLGLVNETHFKALNHMVNKRVESYIHELKQPTSSVYKDYKHLKPSPIIHAGSLYHFKPPNLGQRDFEEWMRKHRRKKSLKSYCSTNIAFGRSASSQRCNSAAVATQAEAKNDSSFIKCMRGKLNARREVLKAIQDYHINAEARSQLEKRAMGPWGVVLKGPFALTDIPGNPLIQCTAQLGRWIQTARLSSTPARLVYAKHCCMPMLWTSAGDSETSLLGLPSSMSDYGQSTEAFCW